MTQGNATLVLDLGNSETRGTVLFGKDNTTGRYRERSFELSNRFASIPADYKVPARYNEDNSTIIEINTKVNGFDFAGSYANGLLQQKEFNVAPLRPSALEKKYATSVTALSYDLAMLHAFKAILALTRTSSYEQLDITWNIVVLLPPGDLLVGTDKMVETLRAVTSVKCSLPEVNLPIKINSVTVLPEGFCGYIAIIYDKGHIIRLDQKYLLKETTLLLDIGAGTSDAMVIQDNEIIETTMHTIERGGNNVTQIVKKAIKTNHNGLTLSDTDIQRGMCTGFVKDGSKIIDITSYINEARETVASYMITDLQGYFEENEFPVRSIGKLLVFGGGALSGDDMGITEEELELGYCSKIKPLSETIIEYLKRLTPNVELVEIPTHIVQKEQEDGSLKKVEEKMNLRHLNILGASIYAEIL